MNTELFMEFMDIINEEMKRKNREILLIMDNCGPHRDVELSHVKVLFLPPNTTSKLQPLDLGIIQAFKMHYRKQVLSHLIAKAESVTTAREFTESVTILDAIR